MKDISNLEDGFCTKDYSWCAVPFGETQYIILNKGSQVHLCRSLRTAFNFIEAKDKTCM